MHFWRIGIRNRCNVLEKNGIKQGIRFGKIGIRNRYVFEALMARPHPKSTQVPLPQALLLVKLREEIVLFSVVHRDKSFCF